MKQVLMNLELIGDRSACNKSSFIPPELQNMARFINFSFLLAAAK